jgi:hypothetical protein
MGRILTFGVGLAVCALVACGGKKEPAKDPSDTPPAGNEDTPKWEGATADDTHPASSSGGPSGKPSSSGGTTAPVEQPKRRSDQYDKEGTEVSLKRAARQVHDNCGQAKDDNGKAIGPWGKVTIQVALGANGHTKGTTVPSPYQGKPVGTCIERCFTNLSFPPWSGSDTSVDWEVELVEPGKEGKK